MGSKVRLIALLCVLALPALLSAGETWPAVCRLKVTGADGNLELTGFKVVEMDGVYTALHGVCRDPEKIVAVFPSAEENGKPTSVDMKVTQVDVEHDVAFLQPVNSSQKLPEGFKPFPLGPARLLDNYRNQKVYVVGYPLSLMVQVDTTLTVRRTTPLTLGKYLPVGAQKLIQKRFVGQLDQLDQCSPSCTEEVLCLDGNLLPGHSGAPILTESGTVIGIGIGGLDGGRLGFAWATPFHHVRLRPVADVQVSKKLNMLSQSLKKQARQASPLSVVFAVLDDDVRKNKKQLRIISRVITEKQEPALCLKRLPSDELEERVKRLQAILAALKSGKGLDQFSPEKELAMQAESQVMLPSGTVVEILGNPVKPAEKENPAMPAIPNFPNFGNLPGGNPNVPDLGALLGGKKPALGGVQAKLINQMWTKVRVPSIKDKDGKPVEIYAPSTSIRNEVVKPE